MSRLKILVVDDDQGMVKTISDILQMRGYDTVEAYSGEEAIEKARQIPPDCVVMDIRMPGMDGIMTMKKIKAEAAGNLPVILMSAYATDEQVEKAKRSSALAVLSKPIDLPTVLLLLTKLT